MEQSCDSSGQQTLNNHQQQQIYITDPHQYLKWCIKDKKIKVMDQCNPIMSHVYLKDISLHKKGPLQDKIYSKNNKYYWNIRRGNTLCQIYDNQQQQKQLFMCRRGMKKFYDLQPEFLKINRNLTYKQQRFRKRIFQKLDQTLQQGNTKIHLYSIFKENGEHCQISYLHQLNCWLFASKNVSILVRNQEDLQNHYHKQRFYWAKLIGSQFFKILRSFKSEQIKEFIQDIKGKTLLGQHCGYQQHQHITKYDQIQIIFYGLVDNNGNDHCLPVEQCQNFLNKYGLKMSRMESIMNIESKHQVYENMYKMLQQVGEGTMEKCGEGSVMYIVSENKQKQQKTISMCKLKTCQYLIFRRIRQMIKIYFAKKGETANNFQKFKYDIQNLCKTYFKPPKQLKYYFKIAKQAFNQVKHNQADFSDDQFRYKFVNFIENVMKNNLEQSPQKEENDEQFISSKNRIILICLPLTAEQISLIGALCKKYKVKVQYIYRSVPNQNLDGNYINVLHMVPRINKESISQKTHILLYRSSQQKIIKLTEQLQSEKNAKKSHLISFTKSPNKHKALELLNDKIKAYGKSLQQNQMPYKQVQTIDNLLDSLQMIYKKKIQKAQHKQSINKQQDYQQKKNYVIVTMAIPGSGKTTICHKLQQICIQKQIDFKIISSDEIRKNVMQKFKAKNPKLSDQQLYNNTKKQGLSAYRNAINEQLNNHSFQKKIIFIDRVFCPTTILKNLQEINNNNTTFMILTQNELSTKLNDCMYPLSVNHLLTCLKRSLERQSHQTLSTSPNEIVRVILKFFKLYQNFRTNTLTKQFKQANISAKIISLNFTAEDRYNEGTNVHLKRKIEQCLKLFSYGQEPPQSDTYSDLIKQMYKFNKHTQENEEQKDCLIQANCLKILGQIDFTKSKQ